VHESAAVAPAGLVQKENFEFAVLRSFSWKSSERWVDGQVAAAEVDEGDEGLG
jgi:hypothetical protein